MTVVSAISNIRSLDITSPGVGEAIGALRREADDFDQFSSALLDELDEIRGELLQREQALLVQQERADEREIQLDAADARLDASRRELEKKQQRELAAPSSDESTALRSTDNLEELIVGSVMDQFAKLQRDAAQRRSQASREKSSPRGAKR